MSKFDDSFGEVMKFEPEGLYISRKAFPTKEEATKVFLGYFDEMGESKLPFSRTRSRKPMCVLNLPLATFDMSLEIWRGWYAARIAKELSHAGLFDKLNTGV